MVHQTTGRLLYLHEDNGFAASPTDTTHKTFGSNPQLTTAEASNNAVPDHDPNSRLIQDLVERQFAGSFSVQFRLTADGWWLQEVLDDSPSTSGAGPYTHTYQASGTPSSMKIFAGSDETGDERQLIGCVVQTATIDVSVENEATVTLNGVYADEAPLPGSLTAQTTPSYRTLTYADGSVAIDSTTKARVQDASLTIDLGTELIQELGSRFAADYSPRVVSPSLDITKLTENEDELKAVYGGSAVSEPQTEITNTVSATLTFDRGTTGTAIEKLTFNLTGTFPESIDRPITLPTENIEDTLNRLAQDISVDLENNDSSAL